MSSINHLLYSNHLHFNVDKCSQMHFAALSFFYWASASLLQWTCFKPLLLNASSKLVWEEHRSCKSVLILVDVVCLSLNISLATCILVLGLKIGFLLHFPAWLLTYQTGDGISTLHVFLTFLTGHSETPIILVIWQFK